MHAKVIVDCVDVTVEELYLLLQAVRDCEQANFKEKTIGIWIDAPELSENGAKAIIGRIKPPFDQHWEIPNARGHG